MTRRNLILRYSNFDVSEHSTVTLHIDAEDADRRVWWGWWKKPYERVDPELFGWVKQEADRRAFTVGLLNRKSGEYWTATCIDVVFSEDDSRIAAPDPDYVPEYYRDDKFPAWFQLTQFRQIDRGEFVRLFGSIPPGDPTLYVVDEDNDGKLTCRPEPQWAMEQRVGRCARVLHLSDLHFGADHAYPLVRYGPPHSVERKPLVDIIYEYLDRNGIEIGAIAVTGDLTTAKPPSPDAFSQAAQFLRDLAERLDLEKHNVIVVPGNHDIRLSDDEVHPTRQYEYEAAFRNFIISFYVEEVQELERIHRITVPDDLDLIFVGLNSARLRSKDTMDYGYIGSHRYEDMFRYIETTLQGKIDRSNELKITLLHHHLISLSSVDIPEPKRPVSLTLDAGELLEQLQKNGVRLALHGHQHAPFVARTSRAFVRDETWQPPPDDDIVVIGMGSSGASRLPSDFPFNYFGIYDVSATTVGVTFVGYTPTREPVPKFTTLLQL